MKKKIISLQGTPVPVIVGLLFMLWAAGFAGVMYVIYDVETNAHPISLEARFGSDAR